MGDRSARWAGVLTLFVVAAISYVDRINIAVLITDNRFLHHFGMAAQDRTAQGTLATAFMLGYGVSSLLLTPLCAALFGVRRSLVCGLVFWGSVACVSPWLSSYGMLLASRVLLGVSEGPLFSLASAYVKAHFDASENGKPNSIVNMGTGFGLAIGYPLVGYLVAGFQWEDSFYAVGMLNVVLAVPLVLAFIRMPRNDIGASAPMSLRDAGVRVRCIVAGALRTRQLFTLTLLTSAFLSYLWGSGNWLPAYLKEVHGFSLQETGWLASLPQYALMLGVLLGGLLIDRLRRDQRPLIFVGAGACVAGFVLCAISTRHPDLATCGLIAANLCCGMFMPAIPSTVQAFSRPEHTASAFGVVNGVASLAAGFMPALMGSVIGAVSASGGKASGFFAGFALLICSQLVVLACGLRLWLGERKLRARHPFPSNSW